MHHALSADDLRFRSDFEAGRIAPDPSDHRAHLRLACGYLVEGDVDDATARMASALRAFLARHGIAAEKYHATLTRGWMLPIHHFPMRSAPSASADEFLARNPRVLDRGLLGAHHSADPLASAAARAAFVEPDLPARGA
ncbi:MAG TPA: hypothetical protein VK081_12135 [Planctomycetota bacterium]|nr:hypothetical protein [Planctomycetota bacterium]